jgi:hypothetical protein
MNELRESYKENLWLAADCIISLALEHQQSLSYLLCLHISYGSDV